MAPKNVYNDVNGNKPNKDVQNVSNLELIKFRLWFYAVNLMFVFFTVWQLVNIDYENHGDERLLFPQHVRFRYYTIWNYKIHLVYLPLAMYCDWLDLKKNNSLFFSKLKQFRHFIATALLSTTTLYVDLVFWIFWLYDRELIVPSYCDVIISNFNQHCLHTLTLITVLVDLATVPRKRPADEIWHHRSFTTLILVYMLLICTTAYETGKWIYPFMDNFGVLSVCAYTIITYLITFAFYEMQWFYIDIMSGIQRSRKLK